MCRKEGRRCCKKNVGGQCLARFRRRKKLQEKMESRLHTGKEESLQKPQNARTRVEIEGGVELARLAAESQECAGAVATSTDFHMESKNEFVEIAQRPHRGCWQLGAMLKVHDECESSEMNTVRL